MSVLFTSDLHFTNNPCDEYRWELFPWLIEQVKALKIREVVLLGDLTDSKDHHASKLVNRLCTSIRELAEHVDVFILRGNHDCVDQNNPFFGFLRGYHGVHYISVPTKISLDWGDGTKRCWFLPSVRDYTVDWPDCDFDSTDYIFAHATFKGAEVENGTKIGGIPLSYLDGFKGTCISGDVHVPQRLGSHVTYVGAPYHVHFGDSFDARVLVLKGGKLRSLHFETLRRPTIQISALDQLDDARVRAGDQVKIRVQLQRAQYATWPAMRSAIKTYALAKGWNVCGLELLSFSDRVSGVESLRVHSVDPKELVRSYAKRKKVSSEVCAVGLALIERVI